MDTRPQGTIPPSPQGFDYNDSDYQRQRNNGSMDWVENTDPEGIKNEASKNGALQSAGIAAGVNVNGKYNK